MAFTYTVCSTRDSSVSIRGRTDSNGRSVVNHTAEQGYRVVVTSGSLPSVASDIEVACIQELPVINYTTWYNAVTGVSMPFAVCRSKEVTRREDNAFVFDVSATFETGDVQSEQCAAAPPTTLENISPLVTVTVGSYERVMYTDKKGKQCWQLPGTDTPFQTPVTETIPTLTLTIEQFEPSITYDQMLERSFKTNTNTYRNRDKGLWMIGSVKSVEQTVQLASGWTTAARVTYPIMLSERYFYPPGVSTSNPANRTVYGHEKVQPLVDTMHVDADDKVVPTTKNGQVVAGYINDDGTKRDTPNEDDQRPDYMRFVAQDEINFNTFLLA